MSNPEALRAIADKIEFSEAMGRSARADIAAEMRRLADGIGSAETLADKHSRQLFFSENTIRSLTLDKNTLQHRLNRARQGLEHAVSILQEEITAIKEAQ